MNAHYNLVSAYINMHLAARSREKVANGKFEYVLSFQTSGILPLIIITLFWTREILKGKVEKI